MEKYNSTYAASCQPQFWNQVADQFHWNKGWNRDVPLEYNFDISKGPVYTRWFAEGETNICYNSVDRHLAEHGAKPAIIWEGNDGEEATLTFSQLHQEVSAPRLVLDILLLPLSTPPREVVLTFLSPLLQEI